jgi:hypothetical protein
MSYQAPITLLNRIWVATTTRNQASAFFSAAWQMREEILAAADHRRAAACVRHIAGRRRHQLDRLQHAPGRYDHHQREQAELDHDWRQQAQTRAGEGAGHAEQAEYQSDPDIDQAAVPVIQAGNAVAVTATTPKLIAMADLGSTCSRYISAGSAMVGPSNPDSPSTSSVARPAITADKPLPFLEKKA